MIKLGLGFFQGDFYAADALCFKGGVLPFGDEGDLVFQVVHPVIDRCCREHQYFGFHTGTDDVIHQPRVAGMTLFGGAAVTEVMGFINHDQVIVAPVDGFQIDLTGFAGGACQVGVVEYVVVEAICR